RHYLGSPLLCIGLTAPSVGTTLTSNLRTRGFAGKRKETVMPHWSERYRWLAALAIFAGLILTLACGGNDEEKQGGSPGATSPSQSAALKIGALMSFTGDLSKFGQPIFNGAELAVGEINASGGVLGNQVQLVRADDGTSPRWPTPPQLPKSARCTSTTRMARG